MKYSSAYIKRYLSGQLSPEQMHELEKAALEDPLLADAIEGLSNEMENYEADVELLKNTILNKHKKRNNAWVWKVAASVLLLIMATVLIFQLKPESEKKLVADTTTFSPTPETDDTPVTESMAAKESTAIKDTILTAPTEGREFSQKQQEHALAKRNTTAGVDRPTPSPGITKKEDVVTDEEKDMVVPTTTDTQRSQEPTKALSGQAAGVNVERRKRNNISGNKVDIATEDSLSSLNEVVVVGYDSKKKMPSTKPDEAILDFQSGDKPKNARPVIGWRAYENYLMSNKRIDTSGVPISGTVILSFLLDKEGNMSDFIIKKSLSSFYDLEAIRLIKDGPEWKLKKKSSEIITMHIWFRGTCKR